MTRVIVAAGAFARVSEPARGDLSWVIPWGVVALLAAVGAWGAWRGTAGRATRPPASWRDDDAETFPAYDVPLSWDEARAITSLLGVLTRLLAMHSGGAGFYYRGAVVDVSKIKADALLYAHLLGARLGAPRGVDDA